MANDNQTPCQQAPEAARTDVINTVTPTSFASARPTPETQAARVAELEQRFGGTDLDRAIADANASGITGRVVASGLEGLIVTPEESVNFENFSRQFVGQSNSPYSELPTDFQGYTINTPGGGQLTAGITVGGSLDDPEGSAGLRLSFGGGRRNNDRGGRDGR